MTAAARGNVPVAVFNATLSSLIGIFLTPLWIGLVIGTQGGSLPLGKVILDLVLWLLLPLVVGQLSRPVLGAWAQNHKSLINNVDKTTILLLVYTSFCDSVADGVWTKNGANVLLPAFVGAILIFAIVFATMRAVCAKLKHRARRQRRRDFLWHQERRWLRACRWRILIFGANSGLGLILLPILIYHPLTTGDLRLAGEPLGASAPICAKQRWRRERFEANFISITRKTQRVPAICSNHQPPKFCHRAKIAIATRRATRFSEFSICAPCRPA